MFLLRPTTTRRTEAGRLPRTIGRRRLTGWRTAAEVHRPRPLPTPTTHTPTADASPDRPRSRLGTTTGAQVESTARTRTRLSRPTEEEEDGTPRALLLRLCSTARLPR